MENAAKALLIAAGVLVAILLLTLFSYLFRTMAANAKKTYDSMEQVEINKFNQQFLNFNDRGETTIQHDQNGDEKKDYLTTQDIVTIVNMAKESNDQQKIPQVIQVKFGSERIDGIDQLTILSGDIYDSNKYKFKCKVTINPNTKYVDLIQISNVGSY